MKQRGPGSRGFSKVNAGFEDAIAYQGGKALLTIRDVERRPPRPMRVKTLSLSVPGCAWHRPRSPES